MLETLSKHGLFVSDDVVHHGPKCNPKNTHFTDALLFTFPRDLPMFPDIGVLFQTAKFFYACGPNPRVTIVRFLRSQPAELSVH